MYLSINKLSLNLCFILIEIHVQLESVDHVTFCIISVVIINIKLIISYLGNCVLNVFIWILLTSQKDFPGGTSGKEPACQCRRHRSLGFQRAWQPTSVFLPRQAHGQRSLVGGVRRVTKSQIRLEQLSTHTHNQSEISHL